MEEMIGVMMLIAAGTAVGVLMAYILGRSRNASAGYYDVLRIEGGRLISFYHGLCGSVEESYALDEIRLVRFTCRATKGNLTFMGEMQIVKKDGQKSRLYVYDGSTFEKTLVWRTVAHDAGTHQGARAARDTHRGGSADVSAVGDADQRRRSVSCMI